LRTKIPVDTVKKQKIVEIRNLGKSLGGLNIPLLVITNLDSSKEQLKTRKIILIVGRVHPGETNASWITHGIINFLLSDSAVAIELRNRIIFHIVPMINPDGVVGGNHR
jgi:murein tripeptide amidase MpaA